MLILAGCAGDLGPMAPTPKTETTKLPDRVATGDTDRGAGRESIDSGPAASARAVRHDIVFSRHYAGPINKNTPFRLAAIRRLFPDSDVRAGTDMTEGELYPVIDVWRGGKRTLRVTPTAPGTGGRRIFTVVAATDTVRTDGGLRVGDQFHRTGLGRAACAAGIEEYSGRSICFHSSESPGVGYVVVAALDGPDDEVPDALSLSRGLIVEIVWRARG